MTTDPAAALRDARAQLLSQSNLTGESLRQQLTVTTDAWLGGLVGEPDDVALVAVGGYGRRQPAFGSDLDLVLVQIGRAS